MNKAQQRESGLPEDTYLHHSGLFKDPKRRSKKWLWFVPLFLLAGAFVFIRAKAPEPLDLNKLLSVQSAKTEYSPEEINLLNKLGLGQSETVRKNNLLLEWETKKYVAEKFGMNFISRAAFEQNILSKYNLTIAPLPAYTGAIPKENVIELNTALNKIDSIRTADIKAQNEATIRRAKIERASTYIDNDGIIYIDRGAWVSGGSFRRSESALKIAAPKSKLNLEGFEMKSLYEWALPQPKDPIIVWQYKNGYIILTAWDE